MMFSVYRIYTMSRKNFESPHSKRLRNRGKSCGDFILWAILNLDSGMVNVNGEIIDLTRNEFRILKILLEKRGSVVSRQDLMVALWQDDIYVEENTLTVNVGRLRKKLEVAGMEQIIFTKPGSGYLIK